MPRVTILLTSFNHRAYLEAAVESIRAQTFRDFEVLALDDGSSDGSREWISAQSDLIPVFNAQNLGTYATLNVGLDRARGEFVAILNDDDLWAPTKLERQVAIMDADPMIGLVSTDGRFVDAMGRERTDNPLGFAYPRFENGDLLADLVARNPVIASAALIRTEAARELGGFNPLYYGHGDWEMWFRIAEKWRFGFVSEVLTDYRIHDGNASNRSDRILADDLRLREWIVARLPNLESRFSTSDYRRALAFAYAALGVVRGGSGNIAGARNAYLRSIRLQPTRLKTYARYLLTFACR